MCTNIVMDVVSDTEASGLTYFTLYREDGVDPGSPGSRTSPAVVGEYVDVFHKTSDGWRIHNRTVTVALQT